MPALVVLMPTVSVELLPAATPARVPLTAKPELTATTLPIRTSVSAPDAALPMRRPLAAVFAGVQVAKVHRGRNVRHRRREYGAGHGEAARGQRGDAKPAAARAGRSEGERQDGAESAGGVAPEAEHDRGRGAGCDGSRGVGGHGEGGGKRARAVDQSFLIRIGRAAIANRDGRRRRGLAHTERAQI